MNVIKERLTQREMDCLKIVICDDSVSYSLFLQKQCAQVLGEMELEADFLLIHELGELKKIIENDEPDILFLDIMIGEQSSIDFLTRNKLDTPKRVVIMTSFPEEAYNISKIDNALFMVKSRTEKDYLKELLEKLISRADFSVRLDVRSDGVDYIIKTADIIYIESLGNYLMIFLKDKTLKTRGTISGFYKRLPHCFLRIHKSYIVNMDCVARCSPHKFDMINGTSIFVNPKKYAELKNKFDRYIG